jgi:outer membrane protein
MRAPRFTRGGRQCRTKRDEICSRSRCWSASASALAEGDGILGVSVGLLHIRPHIDSPVVGAAASTETIPVLNFHFFVTDRISLNTALGVTRHNFTAPGVELGQASMVPLNLTVQYRFIPPGHGFSPYVGAGANHTVFSRQRGPVFSRLESLRDSNGAIVQAGFDYWFSKKYFLNVDFRKFYIGTDIEPVGGAKIETIHLDPLTIGLAVGVRF